VKSDDVSDRLGISAVLDDYARGVDSKDWDLVLSCFSDDAILDYTATTGLRGSAQEVVDWISASVAAFVMSQHHVTNRHISLDGDEAVCVAELLAVMGMAGKEPGKLAIMWTGGRYKDRFVRTPGGWKIGERTFENSWIAAGPEASGPLEPKR
jgi:ketosteroid isomerase-like protein